MSFGDSRQKQNIFIHLFLRVALICVFSSLSIHLETIVSLHFKCLEDGDLVSLMHATYSMFADSRHSQINTGLNKHTVWITRYTFVHNENQNSPKSALRKT